MCAEMKINGGVIMVGDHYGPDADKTEPAVTVAYEVGKDQAAPVAQAFKANGGEILVEMSMQFWGQGERLAAEGYPVAREKRMWTRAYSSLLISSPALRLIK